MRRLRASEASGTQRQLVSARPRYCATCKRETALTFHHLIPRKVQRRRFFQRSFDRLELQRGIFVCRPCHVGIHRRFDEMTLGKHYNELDALQSDAILCRHFAWVARQKFG
ncbi:MAG: hypothetical protein AB8B57_13045 [Congregibacter sp.]